VDLPRTNAIGWPVDNERDSCIGGAARGVLVTRAAGSLDSATCDRDGIALIGVQCERGIVDPVVNHATQSDSRATISDPSCKWRRVPVHEDLLVSMS